MYAKLRRFNVREHFPQDELLQLGVVVPVGVNMITTQLRYSFEETRRFVKRSEFAS